MEGANNISDLRTASFSVYLNSAQENFVQKLGESGRYPFPPISAGEETPVLKGPGKITAREGEIGIFGAEKYFNMNVDEDTTTPIITNDYARKLGYKKEGHPDPYSSSLKSRPGTPSLSSETSWNSQPALLRSSQKVPYQNKQNSFTGRRFFSGFRCNKSCSDKKSIHVSKSASSNGINREDIRKESVENHRSAIRSKQSPPGLEVNDELSCSSFEKARTGPKREEHFAFPVLNNELQKFAVEKQMEDEIRTKVQEEPRVSLEVFGSHTKKKADAVAMNLERKLSILTWDAIPKAQTFPGPPKLRVANEDLESDASSDLFEIENLSGTSSVPPFFTRQVSDGLSGCMTPTSLYEPSEASIEWSVVTASAADFSVVSDYDEKEISLSSGVRDINLSKTTSAQPNYGRSSMEMEVSKGRGTGGLLGCKSYKGLKVAEPAHKINDKPRIPRPHPRADASMPVGKLQAEAKVSNLGF